MRTPGLGQACFLSPSAHTLCFLAPAHRSAPTPKPHPPTPIRAELSHLLQHQDPAGSHPVWNDFGVISMNLCAGVPPVQGQGPTLRSRRYQLCIHEVDGQVPGQRPQPGLRAEHTTGEASARRPRTVLVTVPGCTCVSGGGVCVDATRSGSSLCCPFLLTSRPCFISLCSPDHCPERATHLLVSPLGCKLHVSRKPHPYFFSC